MNIDVYSKLLAGECLTVDGINIYPLTLKEIVKIGYNKKYNISLMNLIATPKDFGINISENENVTTFDIICANILAGNKEYIDLIFDAFKLFLRKDVAFNAEDMTFLVDNNIINRDNYEDIIINLKLLNCIKDSDNKEEEFKPANSRAEEIRNKILKSRDKLKGRGSNELTLFDLISVLAANSNALNILNIWNLTLYQFHDQFSRMQMIEEYDINLRSLLAGAKADEVKLKHYIRKIDNNKIDDYVNDNKNRDRDIISINKVNKL